MPAPTQIQRSSLFCGGRLLASAALLPACWCDCVLAPPADEPPAAAADSSAGRSEMGSWTAALRAPVLQSAAAPTAGCW